VQDLLTFPEQSEFTVFSGIRVAQSLHFWVVFIVFPFVLLLLAIALSDILRFTASDYPFGIFKTFLGNTLNGLLKSDLKGIMY